MLDFNIISIDNHENNNYDAYFQFIKEQRNTQKLQYLESFQKEKNIKKMYFFS